MRIILLVVDEEIHAHESWQVGISRRFSLQARGLYCGILEGMHSLERASCGGPGLVPPSSVVS